MFPGGPSRARSPPTPAASPDPPPSSSSPDEARHPDDSRGAGVDCAALTSPMPPHLLPNPHGRGYLPYLADLMRRAERAVAIYDPEVSVQLTPTSLVERTSPGMKAGAVSARCSRSWPR